MEVPCGRPNRSGLVQVDHGPDHKLYWEEYGNPDGEPVMFLHGGPGGACAPVMSRFFDPDALPRDPVRPARLREERADGGPAGPRPWR